VKVSNGDFLRAMDARVIRGGQKNTWLEIVLDEGKNRHIRRMFDEYEIKVLRLVRVAIGPLFLGSLPKRNSRALTSEESRRSMLRFRLLLWKSSSRRIVGFSSAQS